MKFRKKPVEIEAIQLTADDASIYAILRFMGQKVRQDYTHEQERFLDYCDIVKREGLIIHTLEGTMRADIGDWIIKGINGEFYPCKPDIFVKTYEPVEYKTKPEGE